MYLYKIFLTIVIKTIFLNILATSLYSAEIKNSATVFMYHKFGVDKYPSTSVTISQLENHVNEFI